MFRLVGAPRRAATARVATAMSGSLTTSPRWATTCLLCDEETSSFTAHCTSDAHVARFAVCQTLVTPEKHTAMLEQLWAHTRLDFNAVEQINADKVAKRRKRLASTLVYLRDNGAIGHSLPVATPTAGSGSYRVSLRFTQLAVMGEREMRNVFCDRVARLFPQATAVELRAIVNVLMSKHNLDLLHDMLDLRRLYTLPDMPARLTLQQRVFTVLAVAGELHMYISKEKPLGVGTKRAADALVLNVLASHAMENVLSEQLHHVLQRIVDDSTPVWRAFKQSLQAMSLSSYRPPVPALDAAPVPKPPSDAASKPPSVPVEQLADVGSLPRSSTPKLVWTDVRVAGALDITVPAPANKSANFAPMTPKLATKAPKGLAGTK